jgi:ribosomal-protein-alanine N-acetyltransferase
MVVCRVRPLTDLECELIAGWRYPGRYATYEFDHPPSAALGYHAVVDEHDALIGYCCFGAEARVPGVDATTDVIDVGYGMAPELMGHGRGRAFVDAIVGFASRTYGPAHLRALVLDWNHRSRRTLEHAGFAETGDVLVGPARFVVLETAERRRLNDDGHDVGPAERHL